MADPREQPDFMITVWAKQTDMHLVAVHIRVTEFPSGANPPKTREIEKHFLTNIWSSHLDMVMEEVTRVMKEFTPGD